ncbi:MAG TPA: sigma-70 family RNA polymerase sigma factor [Gemmataceae bacterium]|nr:sigma-70 family RNA polymerase sigma factor [Gemmataceae bacterium]
MSQSNYAIVRLRQKISKIFGGCNFFFCFSLPWGRLMTGLELDGREISDNSLLRRLRLGSEDAATQLYIRYAQRLRALAKAKASPALTRRVDIDEIVQSVFGSFFRGANNGYYDVPVGEELWKLFLVIALNKIRAKGAYHRAAKRDMRVTQGGQFLEECLETDQDSAALSFLRLTIEDALEQLPPQHRQMMTLRIEGCEVAEIAERTGRSKRTVERVLQEARKKLTSLLDEE